MNYYISNSRAIASSDFPLMFHWVSKCMRIGSSPNQLFMSLRSNVLKADNEDFATDLKPPRPVRIGGSHLVTKEPPTDAVIVYYRICWGSCWTIL